MKKLKPVTHGTRHRLSPGFDDITESRPEKSLVRTLKKTGGRNSEGRMTMRYIGGGHKQIYRIIDFKRDKDGIEGTVKTIEYDPNRTCRIALISYKDGEKRYILAPNGLKVGDTIMSGQTADIRTGNAMSIRYIPLGTTIHNLELYPGRGGQLVRSAGNAASVRRRAHRLQPAPPDARAGPTSSSGAADRSMPSTPVRAAHRTPA